MSRWISVDDRVPDVGAEVVAYRPMADESNDPKVCVTTYYGINHPSPQGVMHGFQCWCHVTHWMPLPEPPE